MHKARLSRPKSKKGDCGWTHATPLSITKRKSRAKCSTIIQHVTQCDVTQCCPARTARYYASVLPTAPLPPGSGEIVGTPTVLAAPPPILPSPTHRNSSSRLPSSVLPHPQ